MVTVSRARTPGDRLLDAYTTTRAELTGALTRLLGSPDDALDAAQTAFLKCLRTRSRLEGVGDVKAWFFRVGLNAGRDLRRDTWRRRARPLAAAPAVPVVPPDDPADRESRDRLRAAIAVLSPAEREVFLLRQNSDRTYDEIARLCRVPVGTVKTRMRAALAKLRTVLTSSG